MSDWLIAASFAALAVNLGCVTWNLRQMRRYYHALQQVDDLKQLQLEICVGTWNMRHSPSVMRALREERLRQISED